MIFLTVFRPFLTILAVKKNLCFGSDLFTKRTTIYDIKWAQTIYPKFDQVLKNTNNKWYQKSITRLIMKYYFKVLFFNAIDVNTILHKLS